jgi:hypothetical protein
LPATDQAVNPTQIPEADLSKIPYHPSARPMTKQCDRFVAAIAATSQPSAMGSTLSPIGPADVPCGADAPVLEEAEAEQWNLQDWSEERTRTRSGSKAGSFLALVIPYSCIPHHTDCI